MKCYTAFLTWTNYLECSGQCKYGHEILKLKCDESVWVRVIENSLKRITEV
jgi:hypothetical protein